jgi:phage-related protein
MPQVDLVFYKDADGDVPVLEWLREVQQRNKRAFAKCVARLRRLADLGHDLRRPEADILRDEIYELRAKQGHVNYRILYFFHGRGMAVLANGLTKKDKVPDGEIDRAVERKKAFRQNPEGHSHYQGDIGDGQN